MGLLKDKIALITGASRGIGRGIAAVFAKNGCSVAFTYNNKKEITYYKKIRTKKRSIENL